MLIYTVELKKLISNTIFYFYLKVTCKFVFVFAGGRYVVMVSLHNRLGGHVMRWSNLKGQYWGGASLPTTHDGNFYNTEIKVDV